MSFYFQYHDPNSAEKDIAARRGLQTPEVATEYLGWMVDINLGLADYERLNASAPFLRQVFAGGDLWGRDMSEQEWEELISDPLGGGGSDFLSDPFPPQEAQQWALRWLELWQTDTKDDTLEAVKCDWQADVPQILKALREVVEQAEMAAKSNLLLKFGFA